jgi:hypothetical protein
MVLKKYSMFEQLDVLSGKLKASPGAWKPFLVV